MNLFKVHHCEDTSYQFKYYFFCQKTIDHFQSSLAGGSNAKQDLIDKIAKLEEAKGALNKELGVVNNRIAAERETIDGMTNTLRKIEGSQVKRATKNG